jgi:transposase-like protein
MPIDQSLNPEYGKRLLRGHQMIEDDVTPKQLSADYFEIPSPKGDTSYVVSKYANKWQCTCPDHQFRHVSCKHIHAVTLWQRLTDKLQEEMKKEIVARPEFVNEITCKFCGSAHTIKYRKANDKQVYKCKVCARKFVPNQGFEKMWLDPKIITTTLDLYFKGISLRKISDHLRQCHSLEVDHSTVYRWICKYTDVIGAYIKTLEPEVGKIWHADEMKIKVGGEWKWLWNMMDEKTRFQLVSMIAETREREDAKKTFLQSKQVTSKRPNLVVTDGLAGYKKAFNQEFYDHHLATKHIVDVALQSGLNNSIERMHGSIREREKVIRGIKSMETPIFKGNQIYINFIRPHSALDGKTPAEAAGIGVGGENKWMGLLKRSVKGR